MWGLESHLQAHLVMMAVWSLKIHLWCPLLSCSCSLLWCCRVAFYMDGIGANFMVEISSYQARSGLLSQMNILMPHFYQHLSLDRILWKKTNQIFWCGNSLTCRIINLINIWLIFLHLSHSWGKILWLYKPCAYSQCGTQHLNTVTSKLDYPSPSWPCACS